VADPTAGTVATRAVPRPTIRVVSGLVLLAAVTVAVRLPDVAAAALACGLVAAWAVDALIVRRIDARFTITVPPTVVRGDPVPLTLAVTTPARVARLRQPAAPELVLAPAEAAGPVLDARLTAVFRGSFGLLAPVARLVGPLGLASVDVHGAPGPTIASLPDLPRAGSGSARSSSRSVTTTRTTTCGS
jgi:hypothetical protein